MLAAVQEGRRPPHDLPQLPPHPGGDARQASSWPRASSAGSTTTAAPTCRTGRSTRSCRSTGASRRRRRARARSATSLSHSLDLARFLVGSEMTEVAGALETFVKQRPLPENPKKKGRVTVDDAALSLVRFANGALGTIEGTRFAAGPEELQPVRDQRQQGQRGLRPRADERARVLLARRRGQGPGLPADHGHRARTTPTSRPGGRPGTSSATSTPSPTPSTTCWRRWPTRQARQARLRGRRPQPARARRDREGRPHEALGQRRTAVGRRLSPRGAVSGPGDEGSAEAADSSGPVQPVSLGRTYPP